MFKKIPQAGNVEKIIWIVLTLLITVGDVLLMQFATMPALKISAVVLNAITVVITVARTMLRVLFADAPAPAPTPTPTPDKPANG